MKKFFQYLIIAVGCVLGTLIGIWLIQRYRDKLIDVITQVRNDITERAEQIAAEARTRTEESRSRSATARFPGDSTTDAPPPT
jgi:hypothetical protein